MMTEERWRFDALVIRWREQAVKSREEADRIRRTIKEPTDAEERGYVRSEMWDQCANELETTLRNLDRAEIVGGLVISGPVA